MSRVRPWFFELRGALAARGPPPGLTGPGTLCSMRGMRLALAGVAALAVLAAGCNGGGSEPEAEQPPVAAESADSARFTLFAASSVSDLPFDASCSGIADYARRRSPSE